MAVHEISLDRLPPGAVAHVVRVEGEDAIAGRLCDLGFWPGTEIAVVRRAPLGDPTQYLLRGFRLALRRAEAGRVIVAQRGEELAPVRIPEAA